MSVIWAIVDSLGLIPEVSGQFLELALLCAEAVTICFLVMLILGPFFDWISRS